MGPIPLILWCLIIICLAYNLLVGDLPLHLEKEGAPLCLTCSEAAPAPLHKPLPKGVVCVHSWSCCVSVQYLAKNKNACKRPVCVQVSGVLPILQYLQCEYCAVEKPVEKLVLNQ